MNTAPQHLDDPLADCGEGLEDLSSDDETALLLLAECLRMEDSIPLLRALIEYFAEHAPDLDDDNAWVALNRSAAIGEQLAKAAKLSSDPAMFQQPHDMERLVRAMADVRPYTSNDPDDIRMGRTLYWLVGYRFHRLLETMSMEEALREIRVIGILFLRHFGPTSRVVLRARMLAFINLVEWFADTEGLHDLNSGIVDVEAAALRKFRKGGQDEGPR